MQVPNIRYRRQHRKASEPYLTYFIQAKAGGLIKIGRSTFIKGRLEWFQRGCPIKLRCIAWIPFDCESEIHHKFWDHHRRNEWFEPAEEILRFIRLAAHRGLPGASWWDKDRVYDKPRREQVIRYLNMKFRTP